MTVRSIALGLVLASGLLPAASIAADSAPAAASPAALPAPAETVDPHDLGRGLRYFRATALAADLPALESALAGGPLVLDLRAAQGDPVSTERLQALLLRRTATADSARPLLVLLSAETPGAICAAVPAPPAVVTLGCAGPGFAPAVAVSTDPAQDRAAVAALAAGRPVRELVEEKTDKTRYDEARLARNHANGHRGGGDDTPSSSSSSSSSSDPKAKPDAAAAPEAPLKDLVLQRAVFLHRALLALGHVPRKD